MHLRFHRPELPEARVDAVQDSRDLVCVLDPAGLGVGELGAVAGFRGCDHVGGDQDVSSQLLSQLVAGGLAVVGLDRVADVNLVRSSRATVALVSGVPLSRLMIARRVQVMWSSHSLRMSILSATAFGDNAGEEWTLTAMVIGAGS